MKSNTKEQPSIVAFCEECGARIILTPEEIENSPGYNLCDKCAGQVKTIPKRVFNTNLEVHVGNRVIRMSQKRPILTMGRKNHNDLVIRSANVSRTHAYIVYLEDSYTLFDFSLNGTCIRINGEEEILLKNDKLKLHGRGFIQLGKSVDPNSKNLIKFTVLHRKGDKTLDED
jgi:pSer/pThr/pTyr-binding forkhead associated (FHA) protein